VSRVRGLRDLSYAWYTRRLTRQLTGAPVPRHVALIIDGNRRWARQMGFDNVSVGHRFGAEHIGNVLGWCASAGISHVTIFVASADNLARRAQAEIAFLMDVCERIIAERLARPASPWQVHLAGQLDLVPESTAQALKRAAEATRDRDSGLHVTVAIGYGGRAEVTEAVRSLLADAAARGTGLAELAATLSEEDIAAHLYTSGLPNPDLVIRTSGEQRLSDFLLWQTADSELYFTDVYWPGFRHVDFLRALRSYAQRQRRAARPGRAGRAWLLRVANGRSRAGGGDRAGG
jgi:short-chain Z-isoprenyl diphosphate synthase